MYTSFATEAGHDQVEELVPLRRPAEVALIPPAMAHLAGFHTVIAADTYRHPTGRIG